MKNTPFAKGVRTFLALLAGSAVAWAGVDWITDWKPGAVLVGLNVIAALLGGLSAAALAQAGVVVTSPVGKAVATLLQAVGSFGATYVFASLTWAEAVRFGNGLAATVTSAVAAAVVTYILTVAQDEGSIVDRGIDAVKNPGDAGGVIQ